MGLMCDGDGAMQGRLMRMLNRKWHNQSMCSCTDEGLNHDSGGTGWNGKTVIGLWKDVPLTEIKTCKHSIRLEAHQCESHFSPPRVTAPPFSRRGQYLPGGWRQPFFNIYDSIHLFTHSLLHSFIKYSFKEPQYFRLYNTFFKVFC